MSTTAKCCVSGSWTIKSNLFLNVVFKIFHLLINVIISKTVFWEVLTFCPQSVEITTRGFSAATPRPQHLQNESYICYHWWERQNTKHSDRNTNHRDKQVKQTSVSLFEAQLERPCWFTSALIMSWELIFIYWFIKNKQPHYFTNIQTWGRLMKLLCDHFIAAVASEQLALLFVHVCKQQCRQRRVLHPHWHNYKRGSALNLVEHPHLLTCI